MKNTKKCPKCNNTDIVRIDGHCGPYGVGNNIMLGKTIFSAVKLNSYICLDCGYTESWIDENDLKKIAASGKAKSV